MTLADLLPIRRDPKPRKANRVEVKLRKTEAHLAAVQADNARLLNRQAAADDFFMTQAQLITDLEDDSRRLREELAAEQGARAVADADVEARNRWIRDLEREVTELKSRLEVRNWAEAAAARTQEIDVSELRDRYANGPVKPLHQAPFATTNPGHGTPTWARTD